MWDVIDYFGMDLNRISHSCGFVKVDPPDVKTVIGLVGGLLFSLVEVYVFCSSVCHTLIIVIFYIFCGGGF